MLQQTNQPLSNYQIFNPVSTGSPRFDLYNHLSKLPQTARIDFDEHSVIGNLIFRVEPDLCGEAEREAEAKIVSVPYAERVLGNLEDAIEFIRCVKLIAGDDARAFNLQIIASHYYKEVRTRFVNEVLKEMGMLAIGLSAVTAKKSHKKLHELGINGAYLVLKSDVSTGLREASNFSFCDCIPISFRCGKMPGIN